MRLAIRRKGQPASTAEGSWLPGFRSDKTEIDNWNGVSWHEAPVPPKRHRCTAQTRGWVNYFNPVFRCACGAISRNGVDWVERNSRGVKP